MAAFFLLLALIGGALVGDLVWENSTAGEVTVLDPTVTGYPQSWLLAAAAVIGLWSRCRLSPRWARPRLGATAAGSSAP
jgi:hypothetical protein